jgi:hypothetical protein
VKRFGSLTPLKHAQMQVALWECRTMDIEQLIHEAGQLHGAASLLRRLPQQ